MTVTAPPANDVATAASNGAEKVKKPVRTFMLHKPDTLEQIGKFSSTDYRYAALKAATRGHTDIWLRETNTKIIYVYTGRRVDLENPQEIRRGNQVIVFKSKPEVKFVKKQPFGGDISHDNDPDPVVEKPKTKRRKKAAAAADENEAPSV